MKTTKPCLKGGAAPNAYRFWTKDGSLVESMDVIFPILKQINNEMHLVGTGFFIAYNSLFVTATHVIRDVLDDNNEPVCPIGICHFINEYGITKYVLRPIEYIWTSEVADVCVGLVSQARHDVTGELLTNDAASLSISKAQMGERVVTFAFPDFVRVPAKNGMHFRPNFYNGLIEEYYPNGRDKVLMPWPCYRTNIHLHGGSSGGPVANSKGKIFGVNCRSMDPDTDISFITPIDYIFDIEIDFVQPEGETRDRKITIRELIEKELISAS